MASKIKTFVPASPSYVDFEPACEWKEEGLETMIIHLPDFKKEEMRVQLNKGGLLKITGERPTDAAGKKIRRFTKETKKPDDCNINEIRAKFMNGQLHIIMPKNAGARQQPASTSSQQGAAEQKLKAQATVFYDDKKTDDNSDGSGKIDASTTYDHQKGDNIMYEHQSILQSKKKLILGFGIAAVTMLTVGAFVPSRYGSANISSASFYMED